jgi:hypothetical protein
MKGFFKRHPKVLEIGRIVVPLPVLGASFYLAVISSNVYWVRMVGYALLILSLGLILFSGLSFLIAVLMFMSEDQKGKGCLSNIFTGSSFGLFVTIVLFLYYSSLTRKYEVDFWLEEFSKENTDLEIVAEFHELYLEPSKRDRFIQAHTIIAHDILSIVTIIWFVLLMIFVVIPSGLLHCRTLQKLKTLKREMAEGNYDERRLLQQGENNESRPDENDESKKHADEVEGRNEDIPVPGML